MSSTSHAAVAVALVGDPRPDYRRVGPLAPRITGRPSRIVMGGRPTSRNAAQAHVTFHSSYSDPASGGDDAATARELA
jgi:hypothetical protein